MKIATFSAFCVDHFPQQNIYRPGGNSFNFAIHSKKMGVEQVSAVGFIGNDNGAGMVTEPLKENSVDISHLFQKAGSTASNKIYNTPDGERYSKNGDWHGGVMENYSISEESWEFILGHDIWAVPCLDSNLDKAVRLKTKKNRIVVDFLHIDSVEFISKYLYHLDITFISTQRNQLDKLKELSFKSKKLVVVTLGAEGSVAFNSGEALFQPAIQVKKVVDTTGCGDTFQAAFTCTFFNTGKIGLSLHSGATEAEKVIHNYGGI